MASGIGEWAKVERAPGMFKSHIVLQAMQDLRGEKGEGAGPLHTPGVYVFIPRMWCPSNPFSTKCLGLRFQDPRLSISGMSGKPA